MTLFESSFLSLILFAEKYVRDREQATDIAQECFVRLWYGDLNFETEDKIKGFLYMTARNLALNKLRHNSVANRYVEMALLESDACFQENIMEEEISEIVYRAIDQLAGQSRKIILLSLQGYSNGEISRQLGISINTVNTLKQKAYKKLRSILKELFVFIFLTDISRLN